MVNPVLDPGVKRGLVAALRIFPRQLRKTIVFTKVFQVVVVDFPSRIGDTCTRPQGLGFAA